MGAFLTFAFIVFLLAGGPWTVLNWLTELWDEYQKNKKKA